MWAILTGASWLLKKKNQVKSPSPESRVPETGSNPPIGSGRDSGRDIFTLVGVPVKRCFKFVKRLGLLFLIKLVRCLLWALRNVDYLSD